MLYGIGGVRAVGRLPALLPRCWSASGAVEVVAAPACCWSLLVCLAVVAAVRGWARAARGARGAARRCPLGVGAVLLAVNWGVYIYAVNSGQVVEASLGYYINPLVTVLLGVLVLRSGCGARSGWPSASAPSRSPC